MARHGRERAQAEWLEVARNRLPNGRAKLGGGRIFQSLGTAGRENGYAVRHAAPGAGDTAVPPFSAALPAPRQGRAVRLRQLYSERRAGEGGGGREGRGDKEGGRWTWWSLTVFHNLLHVEMWSLLLCCDIIGCAMCESVTCGCAPPGLGAGCG